MQFEVHISEDGPRRAVLGLRHDLVPSRPLPTITDARSLAAAAMGAIGGELAFVAREA